MKEQNKKPQTTHGSEQNEELTEDNKLRPGLYLKQGSDETISIYGVGKNGIPYNLLDSRKETPISRRI
ncbi:hypothetical protein AB3Y68_001560 [Staphylococcus pseudintermedius]|nr:hypothetical protein [Staphylococcus pseudintermedius]MCE5669544.1 hypothetical protein [Staphylococcus pseudintermedius]